MTEDDWLAAQQIDKLLTHSIFRNRRKCRLLACACARRALHLLTDACFPAALDGAEAFADGWIGWDDLKAGTRREACAARDELFSDGAPSAVRDAAVAVVEVTRKECDWSNVLTLAALAIVGRWGGSGMTELHREEAAQLPVLRDIFGNPFRPVTFSPAWRTGTAVALARQMYDSRDFGAMPILADALQEAGCDSEDVLNHCRDLQAAHVRGCWVVDLVLGKE